MDEVYQPEVLYYNLSQEDVVQINNGFGSMKGGKFCVV